MGFLRLPFIITFLLLSFVKAEAIDISATGGWTETIDASDLTYRAGSNLNSDYESTVAVTTLTISKCKGKNDNWRVDVKRIDSYWHDDTTLYVKRVSDGDGQGSISGGLSFIKIKKTENEFFSGAGNRDNVNLQYKISDVSISISPGNYSTTVVFTVVDIP